MATKTISSTEAAKIIFGPTFYPLYKLWHRTSSQPSQAQYFANNHAWKRATLSLQGIVPGCVPSSFHFKTFMNWLRFTGNLFHTADYIPVSTLPVASKCGHLIHPGNPRTEVPFCPVCLIEQSCESLKRISKAWEKTGGGPTARESEPPALYFAVRKVWMAEKVRFVNLVFLYEQLGEEEAKYENEELNLSKHSFEELKVAKSCMEALQVARENCPYLAGGGDVEFVPGEKFSGLTFWEKQMASSRSPSTAKGDLSPCSPPTPPPMEAPLRPLLFLPEMPSFSPPPSPISLEFRLSLPLSISHASIQSEGHKTVTFADDCVEHEKRRSIHWHRKSPHYEPGRHACPSNEGYFDTSSLLDTECNPKSSSIRVKFLSILESYSIFSQNISSEDTDDLDSGSDTESDGESSDSSVIVNVDGENDGSSRQSYHLAEKLEEECGDGGLPYEDEIENSLSLEYSHLDAIAFRDQFMSSMMDVDMLGNKEITEREEGEQVKNLEPKEKSEGGVDIGKETEMEMIPSSLGPRSRENFEHILVDRDPAETKRPRTESSV